jgi:hypothetical protein
MAATQITVYVQAIPGKPDFGDTQIIIPETDENRQEFLEKCEQFFKSKNRPQDADKFHQAIAQTPSS